MEENKLLMVVCNQGFCSEIIALSREMGCSGATILSGRGTEGIDDTFLGMKLTPEKEIILIILNEDIAADTMEQVSKKFGTTTPACAFCFLLPVDMVTQFIKR